MDRKPPLIATFGAGPRIVLTLSALAMGVWIAACRPAHAGGEASPPCRACGRVHPPRGVDSLGTLGYGPPGVHPGFQGFGLGYHPGYGYGGDALGVGAEGGYPFYGGPGYPHPAPCLRRLKKIVPFAYYGGPGGPDPLHPNFFGAFGPLAPDKPVVTIGNDASSPGDYGPFTGAPADPEERYAPFAARAAREVKAAAPRRPSPPRSAGQPASEVGDP
ncbi:MAG: hypothetical protein U0790_28550 [Isosphaeraceae bacterium]